MIFVLKDVVENIGAQLVKDVASKTADQAGDGTTTATVLAHAIFKEGLKYVTSGANPISLKRGMDLATSQIIENLKVMSKAVENRTEIEQVATISANSDKEIGKMIADAMDKVGKDGIITVEEASGISDELVISEGVQFDRGFLSPHFINNTEKMIVEFANPYILLIDRKVQSIHELVPTLEFSSKSGRALVIISDDIESEALSALVMNKLRGALNVAVIKSPGFGDRKHAIMGDLAVLTGGTLISEETGIKITDFQPAVDLGTAGKIIISKDTTTIVEGRKNEEKLTARINQIKNEIAASNSEYDISKLKERLAKLTAGVAVIKVGGSSEVEVKEKKDRVDDALGATKAAIEEGFVIGGGVALIKASMPVKIETSNVDEELGVKIILNAVKAPLTQIALNAGYEAGVVLDKILNSKDLNIGFDASTGEYVNMFEAGIIDPTKVERVALLNAVSIASLLLTSEAVITESTAEFPEM